MDTKKQKYRKFIKRSMFTGFVGGLLLVLFSYLFYIFNFIELSPKAYLLDSWSSRFLVKNWQGVVITYLLGIVMSLLIAIMYVLLFKKLFSLWLTIIFGTTLWGTVVFLWPVLFNNIPTIHNLSVNTIVSSLGLFILYGTFIGYSISFDYKQFNTID